MSATLRAVVVEDEPALRRELVRLCGQLDGVEVVGESGDLAAARRLVARLAPDLLLLDVRLGTASGLDLLSQVDPHTAVVLVTAFSEHAAAAYEHDVVDYVVKPVREARLAEAVARARRRLLAEARANAPAPAARPPAFLVEARDEERALLVRPADIVLITADGDHTEVVVAGRPPSRVTIRRSLRAWLERLDAALFVRVHRRHVVNLRHVVAVDPWSHNAFQLRLAGVAEPVTVSRRSATLLRKRLR